MKRYFAVVLLLCAIAVCFCSCNENPTKNKSSADYGSSSAQTSSDVSSDVSHSALFLEDYTTEQVLEFFEEVVLNMEYSDGTGNVQLVQKWTAPIYYRIYGDCTDTDRAVLNGLFSQLNDISGFPKIYEAEADEAENLSINFLNEADFTQSFSDVIGNEYAFGAGQFWYYTDTNELHTARVGYRTDIDQATRNSILLEEIINVLGISDTLLREDSIVYQYSNDNLDLSDMDLLILKLLYSPQIKCGMDNQQSASVIAELYF